MRLSSAIVVLMCATLGTGIAVGQSATRYDDQILQDVNKFVQSKKEYQGVKAKVEDQIVTVEGTVNLYFDKMNLEKRSRR